ncbi:MAG TPA: DUF1828 domain-containing protein [Terrimicrobiaceae bacterium]
MIPACDFIAQNLGALFTCSEVNGYTRIRTPFLYPDGDVIDLFVSEKHGTFTITDLGETMRWLRMQSLAPKRSPKQQKLVEDVCLTHGLEFYRGMLLARAQVGQDFASVAMRVAQGALRVSDLWFTMRTRSVESATDEVELFLMERNIPFERGQQLAGRSGRSWRPDFHTRTPNRSSLVYVLSTGSRAAAHGVAEHVLAAWYDLNNLKIGPEGLQFVSLFDDTMDVWSTEDFNLVKDLSQIARWSQPEEFADILAA